MQNNRAARSEPCPKVRQSRNLVCFHSHSSGTASFQQMLAHVISEILKEGDFFLVLVKVLRERTTWFLYPLTRDVLQVSVGRKISRSDKLCVNLAS